MGPSLQRPKQTWLLALCGLVLAARLVLAAGLLVHGAHRSPAANSCIDVSLTFETNSSGHHHICWKITASSKTMGEGRLSRGSNSQLSLASQLPYAVEVFMGNRSSRGYMDYTHLRRNFDECRRVEFVSHMGGGEWVDCHINHIF
ncbi:hypothetical protein WJX74_008138 [Apatococcus lobatus]|uniref:Uncharacterized protein n=2 Tax=Apatococcus TaxID=904362 RepID=A0AAW1TA13_9CHLO